MKPSHIFLCIALALGGISPLLAFTVEFFDNSVFSTNTNTMDVALGLTGHTIEDFEDGSLISGLSLSAGGFQSRTGGTAWDGVRVRSNLSGSHQLSTTFTLPSSTLSFGVGLQNFDRDYSVKVNGIIVVSNLRNLSGFTSGNGTTKNGYLKIEAENGEIINNVRFDQTSNTGSIDQVEFDHLAVSNALSSPVVPEPQTFILSLLALSFIWRATYPKKG